MAAGKTICRDSQFWFSRLPSCSLIVRADNLCIFERMEPIQVRTEQPIAAKRKRRPGRPFKQSDPRINRGGVPSEVRAFHIREGRQTTRVVHGNGGNARR